VLAGIAEELGAPLGFRTVAEVRAEMEQVGPWDGDRPTISSESPAGTGAPRAGQARLATWKQLVDLGSMQDGDVHLRASARRAVARLTPAAFEELFPDAEPDSEVAVTVTGDRGSVSMPAVATASMVEGVVWLPANSTGNGVLADVASPGSTVSVKGADR
jgi:NADH-quinone oxidoreductase subunit G